jgi:DNA repair protein RecO
MSELVMEFSPPGEPNEKVFRMVYAVLEALDRLPEDLFAIVLYFEIWILKLSGFYPDLRVCSLCRLDLDGKNVELSVSDQGLCCGLCTSRTAQRLSNESYRLLIFARSLSPGDFAVELRKLEMVNRLETRRLTEYFIGRALEKRPHSRKSLI